MRIDRFLKVSRVIKRRTVAKEVLDAKRVAVNGHVVKAGYDVKIGDHITLDIPGGPRIIIVLEIRENVPANDAASLYREV